MDEGKYSKLPGKTSSYQSSLKQLATTKRDTQIYLVAGGVSVDFDSSFVPKMSSPELDLS